MIDCEHARKEKNQQEVPWEEDRDQEEAFNKNQEDHDQKEAFTR